MGQQIDDAVADDLKLETESAVGAFAAPASSKLAEHTCLTLAILAGARMQAILWKSGQGSHGSPGCAFTAILLEQDAEPHVSPHGQAATAHTDSLPLV